MSYTNLNNPANYQLQGFGQDGMRTVSTTQAYVEGEYYRVIVAVEDSTISATSMVGDNLTNIDVYAGTTIYGLFTAITVSVGEVNAYLAGRTDIDDVWAYIRAYGEANGAIIEGEDCAKAAISPLLDKYYAQASLVMVPSLYKTSIVYSERPLSTDGQLTFTRASNATRVNADGLVEKVRTNLLTYSEQFDNAGWIKTNVSVTADAIANPLDATLTADKIIPNTSTSSHFVSESVSGGIQTQSVYAKAGGYSTLVLFYTVHDGRATFNLSDGTVTETSGTITASISSVGSGWYRCSLSTTLTTHSQVRFYVINGTTWADVSVAGNGTDGVYLYAAQLEVSDFGPSTTFPPPPLLVAPSRVLLLMVRVFRM